MTKVWTYIKKLKKFWYVALVPVFTIIGYVLYRIFLYRPPASSPKDAVKDIKFREKLHEVKENISEANTKAAIEIAVAKTEEKHVIEELEYIKKEHDDKKRRDMLIDLYDRVSSED